MRASFLQLLVVLLGNASTSAALPTIPTSNVVARYERLQPVFQSTQVPKGSGDALLTALEGGRHIQERRLPPGVVCALPTPARHWLTVTLTNGVRYRIGVSLDGGSVYLPEGLYDVTDAAREKVAGVMVQLEEDLRREILIAPKPLIYQVSMLDDGSTLSGIARLLYGDATKWRQIYDANRGILKNPDLIRDGMKLTIPKIK